MSELMQKEQPTSNSVAPLNPESLIEKAISANASIDTIERMIELRSKLMAEQADRDLKQALAMFQGECPEIKKDKDGDRYRYATLSNIVKTIREPLAKHGLSYRYETTYSEKTCTITCVLMHKNGGSFSNDFTSIISGPPKSNDQQQVGSTQSYGRRYALVGALGLVVDEDDDGTQGGKRPMQQQTDDKPWYNSFEQDKTAMQADINNGKLPAEIISELRETFKVSKKNAEQINGLAA